MKNPEHSELIEPINVQCERKVRTATADFIRRASRIYSQDLPIIPILFDLKGRAAGMYRVHGSNRVIRYNPYLFAKYYDDNITTTVPHEVAHYVVDILYGAHRARPHGAEWQQVMLALGVEPSVTGNYDLSGVPVRRQQRHSYQCACSIHNISTARHNKIQRGKARYYCRSCKSQLKSVEG